jgi:hypothetical protein
MIRGIIAPTQVAIAAPQLDAAHGGIIRYLKHARESHHVLVLLR